MRLMTHSALLRKPDHPADTLSIAAQQISRKSSRAVVAARSGVESTGPGRRYSSGMPLLSTRVRTLRALSHPLRLRIIEELRGSDGPLRPKDLAQALGEPGNVVRYHVKTLREAGLATEVEGPEGAAAHERWYIASPSVESGVRSDDSDAATAAAFTDLMRTLHIRHAEALRAAEIAGLRPTAHADGAFWLLEEDAERFDARIGELFADLERASARAARARTEGVAARRYGFLADLYPDSPAHTPAPAGHPDPV